MKNLLGSSLRFKLSLMLGLAIAFVMAALGSIRYQTAAYRARATFDRTLKDDAVFLAEHFIAQPGAFEWDSRNLPGPELLRWRRLKFHAAVTDSNGRIVSTGSDNLLIREMTAHPGITAALAEKSGYNQATGPDGINYRFYSLAMDGGKGAGYILHLARPMNSLEEVISETWTIYALSVPAILTVSAMVAWFFAGRALKPFQEIARAAEHITFENLGKGIDTKRREGEVQALVHAFNSMVKRLEQSFRHMRQFNTDAAHELRTPLAIMQGENEIALRSPTLPPEVRSLLVSNLEELERLTRVVNDMLTLAEAEAGTRVLDKRPIRLRPLLLELIELVEPVGREKDVRIDSGELPDVAVVADKLWIRRAILNVLDNAIKYSSVGGLIEILGQVQSGFAVISVRDHGIGIEAKDLPRIFDRLYRADPSRGRNSGGAGLGLSIVRWIVEAHQGTVNVTSIPGAETTFEIRLPLSRADFGS